MMLSCNFKSSWFDGAASKNKTHHFPGHVWNAISKIKVNLNVLRRYLFIYLFIYVSLVRYWSSSRVQKQLKTQVIKIFVRAWVCLALEWGIFESLNFISGLITNMERERREELELHRKGHSSSTYSKKSSMTNSQPDNSRFTSRQNWNVKYTERLSDFSFLGMLSVYKQVKVHLKYCLGIIFHGF